MPGAEFDPTTPELADAHATHVSVKILIVDISGNLNNVLANRHERN